jgi:predicted RNase H-like nuclease (RuvC/YqgF family)
MSPSIPTTNGDMPPDVHTDDDTESMVDIPRAEWDALEAKVNALTEQNRALQDRVATLLDQNRALQDRVAALETENQALKNENIYLRRQLAQPGCVMS